MEWWRQRSIRERRLLLATTFLLVGVVGYTLLWRPWQHRLSNLRQQVAGLRGDLGWMRQAAARLQQQPASASSSINPPSGVALATTVDDSARRAGLSKALRQLQPQSDGSLQVRLQHARFGHLMSWLIDLKRQQGISVTHAAVTRRSSGQVDARLTLGGG